MGLEKLEDRDLGEEVGVCWCCDVVGKDVGYGAHRGRRIRAVSWWRAFENLAEGIHGFFGRDGVYTEVWIGAICVSDLRFKTVVDLYSNVAHSSCSYIYLSVFMLPHPYDITVIWGCAYE